MGRLYRFNRFVKKSITNVRFIYIAGMLVLAAMIPTISRNINKPEPNSRYETLSNTIDSLRKERNDYLFHKKDSLYAILNYRIGEAYEERIASLPLFCPTMHVEHDEEKAKKFYTQTAKWCEKNKNVVPSGSYSAAEYRIESINARQNERQKQMLRQTGEQVKKAFSTDNSKPRLNPGPLEGLLGN